MERSFHGDVWISLSLNLATLNAKNSIRDSRTRKHESTICISSQLPYLWSSRGQFFQIKIWFPLAWTKLKTKIFQLDLMKNSVRIIPSFFIDKNRRSLILIHSQILKKKRTLRYAWRFKCRVFRNAGHDNYCSRFGILNSLRRIKVWVVLTGL